MALATALPTDVPLEHVLANCWLRAGAGPELEVGPETLVGLG